MCSDRTLPLAFWRVGWGVDNSLATIRPACSPNSPRVGQPSSGSDEMCVWRQPLLPSSMPRRIRLCVNQSSPMKPAATISRDKVQAVSRSFTSYSAFDCTILGRWVRSAFGDATVPGIGGSRCFARRAHCPACDGPAGLVSERHLVVGTPEHHLDGWNRGPCGRCGGDGDAALS